MKSVLISICPQWCEKIASGEKTIEVRKTAPKELPFKCYIYATKATKWFLLGFIKTSEELLWLSNGKIKMGDGFELWAYGEDYQCVNGKVIGEFICDKIDEYAFHDGLTEFNSMGLPSRIYGAYLIFTDEYKSMCLSYDELKNYGKGKPLYGWHISNLKIYDKPRKLSEFYTIPKSGSDCCFGCLWNATPLDEMPCRTCKRERKYLYRPPQSYMYVEELGE